MVTVVFKDVGQGDSIILEWSKDGKDFIGIIDCHLKESVNPTLEYLKGKTNYSIEFILLSHFHFDHFSGMADLFDYCLEKDISIKYFLHSLAPFIGDIYDRIFTSKNIETEATRFLNSYERLKDRIEDSYPVHKHVQPIILNDVATLSFLAPWGKTYEQMSRQISRRVNKIVTTHEDINKLATILLLTIGDKGILLTSDAVKKSFKVLGNKLTAKIVLAQVPHHGSWGNIEDKFWRDLVRVDNCPAVFSVGDEPKDKLPNKTTVDFFDSNRYDIYSTGEVYGIVERFCPAIPTDMNTKKSNVLNDFSTLIRRTSKPVSVGPEVSKYSGDKEFTISA